MRMKTPEEIKRRLELCSVESGSGTCEGCPYIEDEECISHGNRDALAYIRQLEAKVPKWISVEERLPEENKLEDGTSSDLVIVVVQDDVGNRFVSDDIRANGAWVNYPDPIFEITHWMPLPVPPKEE